MPVCKRLWHAAVDDACTCADDGSPDSVTSEINVRCTGNLILKFWVKAIALVISEGKCEPKEYIVCEKCCKDAYGGYIADCDVEDCQTKCVEHERALLRTTAKAVIDFAAPQVSAYCGVDKTVDYQTWWYDYVPYNKHVRSSPLLHAMQCAPRV